MRPFKRILSAAMLGAALFWVVGTAAAEAGLEQEVGSLDGLDEQAARALLVRYAEGRILTYAPMQHRVELLEAVIAASPEGGPTRLRAELLPESAKNGRWE